MIDTKTKEYIVYFDFTTVNKKSMFTGRSGQLGISTEKSLEEVNADTENLQYEIAKFIHSEKPKWNIFMINIKSIVEQGKELEIKL